jgi:Holliday junction resolvasome RuvABC ATP-dependent DNA helicase subunit
MMQMLEIDHNGLDKPMRSYLNALINAGGKLSIQGLSGVLQIEESTILKVIEPILLRKGMISRGSGGRSITSAGRAAISGSADPISIFDSRVV